MQSDSIALTIHDDRALPEFADGMRRLFYGTTRSLGGLYRLVEAAVDVEIEQGAVIGGFYITAFDTADLSIGLDQALHRKRVCFA